MPEIAYDELNSGLCLCYECPVQIKSECAQGKYVPLKDELGTMAPPPAADLPGLYCASGKATCTDLDFTGGCQCPVCTVYADGGLTQWKYCKRGPASEVG